VVVRTGHVFRSRLRPVPGTLNGERPGHDQDAARDRRDGAPSGTGRPTHGRGDRRAQGAGADALWRLGGGRPGQRLLNAATSLFSHAVRLGWAGLAVLALAACATPHVGAGTTRATGLDETARLAEAGDAAAQTVQGNLYETGAFGAPDYGAAAAWYERAADQGDPLARFFLASLYERGLGVGQDYARAAALYRAAAEAGHAGAAFKLGYFHEKGLGVAQDFAAARSWYDLAEQGWGGQRVQPLKPDYLAASASTAPAAVPVVTLIPVASLAGLPVVPETVGAPDQAGAPAPPPPGFYLHLASQRSSEAAVDAWDAAHGRFPDQLDRLQFVLARLDLGAAGIYYQVLAGPLAREEDADIACALLQPQGQYCDPLALMP